VGKIFPSSGGRSDARSHQGARHPCRRVRCRTRCRAELPTGVTGWALRLHGSWFWASDAAFDELLTRSGASGNLLLREPGSSSDPWLTSSQCSGTVASPRPCSGSSGRWTGYDRRPGHLARHFGHRVHLSRCGDVQARVVLGGFFWTIVVLVIALGISWRYLGSYMAAVFEGRVHFLAWAETPCLQSARHRSRAGADLEALCGVSRHLLCRLDPDHLRHPASAGAPLLEPPAPGVRRPGPVVEHRRLVRHQHQLAELRRRVDDVLLLANGRPDRPAVRESRRGYCSRHRACAGFSRRKSATIGNFWVDITRCMLYILLPAAFLAGIIFVGQGAVQTLAGTVTGSRLVERGDPKPSRGARRLHGGDQAARDQWWRVQ